MTQDTKTPLNSPLARWSRLKREAARAKQEEKPPEDSRASVPTTAAAPATPEASKDVAATAPTKVDLPPVESLTFESDFAPYFQPEVDATLKRQALKHLLRDPHFNVMDGLDVYIDDYSKPDPISPEIVRQLVQGRYIFDPPPTRVNAQGHVEDVPPEEVAALKEAREAEAREAPPAGDSVEPVEATIPIANAVPETAAVVPPVEVAAPSAVSSAAAEAKDTQAR